MGFQGQESYNVHRFIFQPFSNSGKSARTGKLSGNTMVKPLRRACPFQFREVLLPIIPKPRWLNTYNGL